MTTRAKSSDPSRWDLEGKKGKGKRERKVREKGKGKGEGQQRQGCLAVPGHSSPLCSPGAGRDQEGSFPEAPGAGLGAAGAARELLLPRAGLPGPPKHEPGGAGSGGNPGDAPPGPAPPARVHPRLRHLGPAPEPETPGGKHGGSDRPDSVSPPAQQGAGDGAVKGRVDFPPGHAEAPGKMQILTPGALLRPESRAGAGTAAGRAFLSEPGCKGTVCSHSSSPRPQNKP